MVSLREKHLPPLGQTHPTPSKAAQEKRNRDKKLTEDQPTQTAQPATAP